MIFEGVQIDIQTIFIFQNQVSRQTDYKHIYQVQNNFVSNHQGNDSDQTITDPCDSNPCQNGGTCFIGSNNAISCFCPRNFNGG
jgi:hypothetical protein